MRQLVFTLLFVISLTGYSQQEYNYVFDRRIRHIDDNELMKSPYDSVSIATSYFQLKNKKPEIIQRRYENNFFTAVFKVEENKLIPINKYEYDQYGNIIRVTVFKKGNIYRETHFVKTPDGKILEWKTTKGKTQKIVQRSTWTYNEDGCLAESKRYKAKGTVIDKKWEYFYYDSCKISRSVLSKGNGKLINEWSFMCQPEGEKLEKKKKITQVCRQHAADTFLTYIEQSFDEKGKITKHVYKKTLKDSLLLEWSIYNEKNQLVRKSTYDKSPSRETSSVYYYKGKKIWERNMQYNNDGLLISGQYYKKGKMYRSFKKEYNNDKALTSWAWYMKNNQLLSKGRIEYSQ